MWAVDELPPFACASVSLTLTRLVVPVARSRTKTSRRLFVSLAIRFEADEVNATKRPSALIVGR